LIPSHGISNIISIQKLKFPSPPMSQSPPDSSSAAAVPLAPGFRFHPTDEELIVHYLMNQAASVKCPVPIIAEVNIYKCNPWDLPGN
jgi:hypothetical protein